MGFGSGSEHLCINRRDASYNRLYYLTEAEYSTKLFRVRFEVNSCYSSYNRIAAFKGDIVIGNDGWIGQNVTIMPGIKIGDGAIIAANSTVVKNVEPYTIVGGNPSNIIKKRFEVEIIELLLELQWWNWDEQKIFDNLELLVSANDLETLRTLLEIGQTQNQ